MPKILIEIILTRGAGADIYGAGAGAGEGEDINESRCKKEALKPCICRIWSR